MQPGRISISSWRSTLAFGLALWCAGIGCVVHGMAMSGTASVLSAKSAKQTPKQSQMSMSGHACCKARHRALSNSSATPATTFTLPEESSDDVSSCCPLTSGSFVTGSRSENIGGDNSELAGMATHEPAFSELAQTDRAIPLRLPNHERTYLTCCVFLI